MDPVTSKKIQRLQESLSALRKVAGWSAEDLGRQLDVTRQTIVNLETGQTKMTKVQYMALRLAFATEIQARGNDTLLKLMTALVDCDGVSEDERVRLRRTVDDAVSKVGRRVGSDAASKAAVEAVKPGLRTTLSVWLTGVCTAAAAVSMLYDLFKKDET